MPQAILQSVKSFKTLDEYIEAALDTARYEKIEKGTKVYAGLPAFRGAWADGRTREGARNELRQVLRGWIELQVERGQPLPALKGVRPPQLTLA
ncbi:MAG TPA: HicB family protein [Spartobacteria bacterium]|nr:HicB family protein [Spartobacteria bacterium]HCP91756.1 HicB family protein [Spartobacteria bacterium]